MSFNCPTCGGALLVEVRERSVSHTWVHPQRGNLTSVNDGERSTTTQVICPRCRKPMEHLIFKHGFVEEYKEEGQS